jgi:hypothetical protein
MYDRVKTLLAPVLPEPMLDGLLQHHHALKTASLIGDWEKCLLRGGKMAEAIMRVVRFLRTGSGAKAISVESEIREAEKAATLPDEMRVLIPRHVRVLYDHRSKRGGGHSSFDPNEMDSHLVVALADWLLAELLRLYAGVDPPQALALVTGLVARQVPLVEDIDGDLLTLLPQATAREEIELVLWKRYPSRTSAAELDRWLPTHSINSIRVTLTRMKQAKDVHANKDGVVLTSKGVRAAEDRMQQRTEMKA